MLRLPSLNRRRLLTDQPWIPSTSKLILPSATYCISLWGSLHLLSNPFTTATIPYITGTFKTIARIVQPYNIRVAHKPITTLRRLLINVKDKDIPEDIRGTVTKIKCCDYQATYVAETSEQKPWLASDWTQTSNKNWCHRESHRRTPFTDKTSNRLEHCDMYNVFYRLLSTTHFRKLVF